MKKIHTILAHIPILGIFTMLLGGYFYIGEDDIAFYTSAISQCIIPIFYMIKFFILLN